MEQKAGAQIGVHAEYGELFFPAKLRWREKALADGRQALEGILRAYQLIG